MNQLPVDAAVQADGQATDDPGPTAGNVGTTTTATMSNDNPDEPSTPRTQRINQIAAVRAPSDDGESPNTTNRQQQEGAGAASSDTMPPGMTRPPGMRTPLVRQIFTPQSEGRQAPTPKPTADTDGSVAALVQMMAGMQETINNLTKQVLELSQGKAAKDPTAPETTASDKAPTIHHKDVEKPHRYDGKAWVTWNDDFKNFLERRDERWGVLLSKIQEKEFVNAPLSDDGAAKIAAESKIKPELQGAFKKQLFEYLRSYTAGETLATVLAAGAEQSWEMWRRLSDQGRCLRLRPLREEHRALYHPKQCTEDGLIKGIASWELCLLNYEAAKPAEEASMSESLKIMCLEDMCPEHIQKHLSSKNLVNKLQSYADYKVAIDEFFYEERRWGKSGRHKLHAVEERRGESPDADDGPDPDPSKAAMATYPEDWAAALVGEINALVKGKIRGKGAGKGYNAGKANHPTPMDVDKPSDAQKAKPDDRKCYECGKLGHIGRDCPIRQARVAAGGPPILKGDGKGGKGGKGGGKGGHGGQWPSTQQWSSWRPVDNRPSMQTWNSWQPGKGGKASLFEAPQQLSAFNALFQGPSAFTIVPKRKAAPAKSTDTEEVDFESKNAFKALEEDALDENLSTTDPPGSGGGGTPPLMRQPGRNPATGKTAADARSREATTTRIGTTSNASTAKTTPQAKPSTGTGSSHSRTTTSPSALPQSNHTSTMTATKSTSSSPILPENLPKFSDSQLDPGVSSTSTSPTFSSSSTLRTNARYAAEQTKNSQNEEDITTATLQSSRLTASTYDEMVCWCETNEKEKVSKSAHLKTTAPCAGAVAATGQASVRVSILGPGQPGRPRRTLTPREWPAESGGSRGSPYAPPRDLPAESGGHHMHSKNEHYVTPDSAVLLKKPSGDMTESKPCTGGNTERRATPECAARSSGLHVGSDQHHACWPNVEPDRHHACRPNTPCPSGTSSTRSSAPMMVNLCDVTKRESLNRARKRRASTDPLVSLSPTCNLDTPKAVETAKTDIEANLDAPPGWVVDSPEAQWEILKATLVPGYRTAEQRQEERRTAMAVEKYEEMRRKEASSTPADACSLTPNGVIGSHQVDHIGHSISELSGETTRWQGRPGYCGAKDPAQKADFSNVNDELIDYICGKTKKMSNLSMFNEVRGQSSICPVTGTAPTSSTSPPTRSAIDPAKWEVMHAVVDSGATVPVLHPKTGGVYQVEESPASRAGVEYEIANGSTLPCLGQKHMAVMTEEGTMRGYTSQCADVSKALQAVRSMVASRHAVCFGLGPAGEDHLIINRESGEINRMIDDGVNYLQKLFVVPPDQVEAVQERLQQAQDFTRRGE